MQGSARQRQPRLGVLSFDQAGFLPLDRVDANRLFPARQPPLHPRLDHSHLKQIGVRVGGSVQRRGTRHRDPRLPPPRRRVLNHQRPGAPRAGSRSSEPPARTPRKGQIAPDQNDRAGAPRRSERLSAAGFATARPKTVENSRPGTQPRPSSEWRDPSGSRRSAAPGSSTDIFRRRLTARVLSAPAPRQRSPGQPPLEQLRHLRELDHLAHRPTTLFVAAAAAGLRPGCECVYRHKRRSGGERRAVSGHVASVERGAR